MNFNITGATVLIREHGTDKVFLYTDLPSTCPGVTNQPAVLQLDVEADRGVEYVKTHFGLEPKVIHQ